MNIGITEPKFAILDDGTQVVIKLAHGPEGNLVLFNEYVCYRLALLLHIPMPHSGICKMDKETEVCVANIASSDNYGYAFYSTFIPKATKLIPSIIRFMKNKDVFNKVLLFDHIIFNTDRNEGNLLVQYYKNDVTLKVIDHTHVFKNGAIWDEDCLNRAITEKDLFSTKVLEYNNRLYEMFYRNVFVDSESLRKISKEFQDKINSDLITKIIEECPEEWRPKKVCEEALKKYLMYRVNNLDIIESTIINYIK